jgi:hypothetical protein
MTRPAGIDRDASSGRDHGLAQAALTMLAREASRAPLVALSLGLQAWDRSRSLRGEVRRRGNELLALASVTPIGRFLPQPTFDDGAEGEAARLVDLVRETGDGESRETGPGETETGETGAGETETGETGPGETDTETGQFEHLSSTTPEEPEIPLPERDALPIEDFDHVSLGSLRARLRSLSLEQLETLRAWEAAHGHRAPVLTLLDNRIAKLTAEAPADAATYPADVGSAT